MKRNSTNIIYGLISLSIFLVSLSLCILDWVIPLNLWIHPILTLFFFLFVGFGVLCLFIGFSKKSHFHFFLSTILLSLALFYLLFQYIVWWLSIICVVIFAISMSIISTMVCGNITEKVDNNHLDSNKKKTNSDVGAEELPKIKSFK